MEKRTILIAEILHENASNGVNRHSEMLLNGLPKDAYRVIYLKLVFYKRIAFPYKIAHRDYLEIAIPIPVNSDEIIGNNYWNAEYNKLIEHFVEPYLTCGFIIHIQTMNLISLALSLRQKYHCKILSHIHCIAAAQVGCLDFGLAVKDCVHIIQFGADFACVFAAQDAVAGSNASVSADARCHRESQG